MTVGKLFKRRVNLQSLPSTSNTMPFSRGLLSPSFLFAGSRGAKRRGRGGAMFAPALAPEKNLAPWDAGDLVSNRWGRCAILVGRCMVGLVVCSWDAARSGSVLAGQQVTTPRLNRAGVQLLGTFVPMASFRSHLRKI